jgi:MEKHLA domain
MSEPYDPALVAALLASHQRLLGTPLVPPELAAPEAARWLYELADFAVLAHDTRADPVFVYANQYAQRCFERGWEELVGMPSRLSAQAPERAERAALLAQVQQHGCSRDYRGIRVARSGRRFWIEQARLWNVHAADGSALGQAASFSHTRPA